MIKLANYMFLSFLYFYKPACYFGKPSCLLYFRQIFSIGQYRQSARPIYRYLYTDIDIGTPLKIVFFCLNGLLFTVYCISTDVSPGSFT